MKSLLHFEVAEKVLYQTWLEENLRVNLKNSFYGCHNLILLKCEPSNRVTVLSPILFKAIIISFESHQIH